MSSRRLSIRQERNRNAAQILVACPLIATAALWIAAVADSWPDVSVSAEYAVAALFGVPIGLLLSPLFAVCLAKKVHCRRIFRRACRRGLPDGCCDHDVVQPLRCSGSGAAGGGEWCLRVWCDEPLDGGPRAPRMSELWV